MNSIRDSKLVRLLLLFIWAIYFSDGFQDKKLNLKIGFDLIPRADGNPSIRFRDFEDFNLRKFGSKSDKSRISVRADTSVESAENKEEEPKEEKESDAEVAAASSESEDRALRSTKGINPDEFEPERNPRIHSRGKQTQTETEEE